jgi:hypothetical protein
MKYITFILLVISFKVGAAVSVLTPNMSAAQWDANYLNSNALLTTCNPAGTSGPTVCAEHFAWVQDNWVRSYISMALFTGDTKYLIKARDTIDFMLTKRSVDGGWGYEMGTAQYILDSAMISRCIALYVYVVNRDSRFINYRDYADGYLSIIEPIIHKFDYQWVDNTPLSSGSSFYRYATCPANPQALCGTTSLLMYNQGAAMASAMLLVDKTYRLKGLSPDPGYMDKVTKSVQYFLNFAQIFNQSYVWNYQGGRPDGTPTTEDLSHGHVDVMFLAWTNGIGGMTFDKLELLSNTLGKKLMNGEAGPYDVSGKVDASLTVPTMNSKAIVGFDYIELSDYNPMLLDRIIYLFNTKIMNTAGNNAALGWAEILRKKALIELF